MTLIHALEAVCDLLPYFALAAIFPSYAGAFLPVGAVLLLTALSSLLLQKQRNIPIRILCGLLPALGLLAACSSAEALFTVPALLIWFVIAVSGKNTVHYEDYKFWFGVPALLTLVLLLVSLSRSMSDLSVSGLSVLCAAAYPVCGVVVLRRKRMGPGVGAGARLMNVAELFGAALIGILACALLWGLLSVSGKILEILLLPLGMLIGAVPRLLAWLAQLFNRIPASEELQTTQPLTEPGSQVFVPEEAIESTEAQDYAWAETAGRVFVCVLLLALFVLIAVLAYKAVKKLRAGGSKENRQYAAASHEKSASGPKRKKKKKAAVESNRQKIRAIYREYLAYIRLNGVAVVRHTTSEEALSASKQLGESDAAGELRLLYIRARYNDTEPPGDEDVRRAKELWERFQKESAPPEA